MMLAPYPVGAPMPSPALAQKNRILSDAVYCLKKPDSGLPKNLFNHLLEVVFAGLDDAEFALGVVS